MSIVSLKKVTLVGIAPESENIVSNLQTELGCMHITGLKKLKKEQALDKLVKINENKQAIKYLHGAKDRKEVVRDKESFDKERILNEIKENQNRIKELVAEKKELGKEIEIASHWGDFEMPSAEKLAGYRLWFYRVPHGLIAKVQETGLIWEAVYEDDAGYYVVVISKEEPSTREMPVKRTALGDKPLSQLKAELSVIEQEIEKEENRHIELTKWEGMLALDIARIEDEDEKSKVINEALVVEDIFALQGWVIEEDVEEIKRFADDKGLAIVIEKPAKDDNPPTKLHNPELLASGESLISFYQMPSYKEWDPSIVVLLSFAVFFAMIMSDAGYGLVLALIVLWKWRDMGKSEAGKGFRRMLTILTVTTIGYGIIAGSYFGVLPDIEILKNMQLLDVNDTQAMMMFSALVGALHVIIANIAKASTYGFRLTALGPLGWVVIILGGVGLYVGNSDVLGLGEYTTEFYITMAVGGGMVLLFTSSRPFNSAKNILLRVFWDGLLGLTSISKAFGDILSYLRLFALGLASAMLATTFNQLAGDISAGMPGIGIVIAAIVLIIGHLLNFVLGIVGGVVHGLRLNLIEFFGWGLQDEGQQFKPFKSKESLL